jgi:hypothetical protein
MKWAFGIHADDGIYITVDHGMNKRRLQRIEFAIILQSQSPKQIS